MSATKRPQRWLCIAVALAMAVTIFSPITSVYGAEKATGNKLAKALDTEVFGDIGTAAGGNYITAMTEDKNGDLIVSGTANSQMGADDKGTGRRVFIKKYAKNDLDHAKASAVILGGGQEDITDINNYAFGSKSGNYYSGGSMENGALATDSAGNVYIAVTEKSSNSLKDWTDITQHKDCICGESGTCSDKGCLNEEHKELDNCPVCNAFRTFKETFKAGNRAAIRLYKYNSALEQAGSLEIGSYATSGSGTAEDPKAAALTVDPSGNVYVGGSACLDLGFKDPTYGFNHFDKDTTGGQKTSKDSRGYIAKVSGDLKMVKKATYLGGTVILSDYSGNHASVSGLAAVASTLYVTGWDRGGKLPTMAGAFQTAKSSEDDDKEAYIAKLSLEDLSVGAATYFGGSGDEQPMGIRVEGEHVYLAGKTESKDLPVSDNAAQKELNLPSYGTYPDVFAVRMGTSLKKDSDYAATYYGGTNREDLFGFDVDKSGNIYVTGECYSAGDIPTTDGSGVSGAGRTFIAKFNGSMSDLLSGTVTGYTASGNQGRGVIASGDNLYLGGQHTSDTSSALQPYISKYGQTLAHSKVTKVTAGFSSSPVYTGADKKITIKVQFDTYVEVKDGTPTLELNVQNAAKMQEAKYTSGSGSKELIFEYTTAKGDTTKGEPLNCASEDALKLNGATILPKAGGTAEDVSLKVSTASGNLPYAKIYINTVPTNVESVAASIDEGTYGPGAEIPLTVTFADAIKEVKGNPELAMNSGGKAVYTGKSKTNKKQLEFLYTVGETENTQKLDYVDEASLTLPAGAAIFDNYDIQTNTTLPKPGAKGSISEEKTIAVSAETVVINRVAVNDKYKGQAFALGKEIPIIVTFSKPVTTTGKMELALNSNTSSYGVKAEAPPVTNQKDVEFLYKVAEDNNTAAGDFLDYASKTALKLADGATITSEDNKAVSLYLPQPGREESLSAAKIVIDTKAPTVNSAAPTKTPGVNYFKKDDTITLAVTASEKLTLKDGAKPYVEMNYKTNAGATENNRFEFDSTEESNGKTKLKFVYKVKEADTLKNQAIHLAKDWKIMAEPGEVTDLAGNDLKGELKQPSSIINPWKGIYFDSIAPVWEEGAALKAEAVEGSKSVKITRPDATDDNAGISNYILYKQVKGSEEAAEKVTTLQTYTKTYTDTKTAAETEYVYTLIAADKAKNESKPVTAQIRTLSATGEDTGAPYWDADAKLSIKRITDNRIKLTWDKSKAHDANSDIDSFIIYAKQGDAKDWTRVKSTEDGKQESIEVDGIDINESYQFKIEARDNGANKLISNDGPTAELKAEYPYFVVKDQKGNVLKNVIEEEIDAMEQDETYPSSYEKPIYKERFSGMSDKEGQKYYTYYAATGISLEKLVKMAGVKNYSRVSVYSGQMSGGTTFTKEEVTGESKQYYYSPKYDGVNVKEKEVKPMIALWYGDSEDSEPDFNVGGEVPRLLYGQADKNTVNRTYFVKEVYYITVSTIGADAGIQNGEGYKVEEDALIPTAAVTKDGEVAVKAKIDGTKYSSQNLDVSFVQMRGNKMVDIETVKHDNKSQFDAEAKLNAKAGDKIYMYILNQLDGEKGSNSQIINDGSSSAEPSISIKDKEFATSKIPSKIELEGIAEPLTWASVKVTDQSGAILYFNGTMANASGMFSIDADLSDGTLPLDVTVTSGKSTKTAVIKQTGKLMVPALTASASSYDKAKLTWKKIDQSEGYEISRATAKNGTYKTIANVKGTSYEDKGLSTGKTYYYRIRAYRTVGGEKVYSNMSAIKSVTPMLNRVTASVKAGARKADISWKKISGASGYEVYQSTKKTSGFKKVKTVSSGATTKYSRSGLTAGKVYYYRVRAYRNIGKTKAYGAYSSVKAVKPALKTPTIKTSAGKRKITIKWGSVTEAKGYQIYRSNKKSGKYTRIKTVKGKSKTKFVNSRLKKGKRYYYKVRAYKTISGKTVYSKFSTVKSARAK